jgi:hypothetical protein
MKVYLILIFTMCIIACTKKNTEHDKKVIKNTELIKSNLDLNTAAKPEPSFTKTLRESIYYSNSLEREALKLILKNPSFQKLTLFSVLSHIVETDSGVKKSTPFGLDCGKFEIQRAGKITRIFKACVKPSIEIAQILTIEVDREYQFDFMIKDWSSVVGPAVALTGSDVKCTTLIKDKKLQYFSCENWSYQTSEDQISSTVIKAKDFVFQRDAKKQFKIKGGFYKELIENKKIDISVPIEGRIKIIEKEIEVIDEFAEKKVEVKNEKKEELKKESNDENNKEVREENGQKSSEEIQFGSPQESNQEDSAEKVSEDVTKENPAESAPTRRGR